MRRCDVRCDMPSASPLLPPAPPPPPAPFAFLPLPEARSCSLRASWAFAATSDSEQSEDGYSSTYSARAAYLSSSPRSARSGTSTRDASAGPGSRGGGHHASRGDFITSWQRGAYAAHSKENSSSHNNSAGGAKKKKEKGEPSSESGSQRESLDIPTGLGKVAAPHRTLSTGGPGSTYSQSDKDNATNATTHGNETPMSLPTTPRSGLSVQNPDSEIDF